MSANDTTVIFHILSSISTLHLLIQQMRMAIDLGASRTKAAFLSSYMAIAQTVGKVIFGQIATFPKCNKVIIYQIALFANCLATTTCPTITTYGGLIAYAVVFGLQDGCTSAYNMLIVGDLVSKKETSTGYSVFLVTSAASFLLGPPLAGINFSLMPIRSLRFRCINDH